MKIELNDYEKEEAIKPNGGAIRAIKALRERAAVTLQDALNIVEGYRSANFHAVRAAMIADAPVQLERQEATVRRLEGELNAARSILQEMQARIAASKSPV